jgi:site-specific DNA-methyltransferase (adenine-specific)
MKMFKYCWVWVKESGTGFLNANKYPLKNNEDVVVFCDGCHKYNPQMRSGKPYTCKKGGSTDNYNKDAKTTELLGNEIVTVSKGERYPLTTLHFQRDKGKIHPTQKPVALMEYLIKTYTNQGEAVLDFTCGSGTTCVAAKNLGRRYIGIELDPNYATIAEARLKTTERPLF